MISKSNVILEAQNESYFFILSLFYPHSVTKIMCLTLCRKEGKMKETGAFQP